MINYLNPNFSFKSIASNATILFPCPDQIIGELKNGKFFAFSTRIDIDYNLQQLVNNKNLNTPIIIVLESPHKDEFDPITLQPIGPAMGKTGENFRSFFEQLLNGTSKSILTNGQHTIILLNAVQFQCSLGKKLSGLGSYKNKKMRDDNFIKCFNNENDFINRIKAINPVLVINLCTIGLKKNNLIGHVSNELKNANIKYTVGSHPSRWNNPNNRFIK